MLLFVFFCFFEGGGGGRKKRKEKKRKEKKKLKPHSRMDSNTQHHLSWEKNHEKVTEQAQSSSDVESEKESGCAGNKQTLLPSSSSFLLLDLFLELDPFRWSNIVN